MSRIVIVEDEAAIGLMLDVYLTGTGFEVARFKDGPAAVDYLQTNDTDLILTDVNMVMNGVELIRRARRMGHSCPVIFMSGNPDISEATRAQLGVHAIIKKPFELKRLSRLIRRFLAEAKQRKGSLSRSAPA